jgi:branched-chain amino acid transport system ATP-binding protein
VLTVKGASTGYGDAQALWEVELEVRTGEAVALVGANGAGKTTLLRSIAGLQRLWRGEVTFDGRALGASSPAERVRRGMILVPERRRLFGGLSVEKNLLLGAYTRTSASEIATDLARMYGLFPALRERRRQMAGSLSGGEQQMCAIARGLMSRPRLLMVDELSLGLAPVVVDSLFAALVRVKQQGEATLFLVEQDVQMALEIADRGYVLETGRIVMSGPATDLLGRPEIRAAYLGI